MLMAIDPPFDDPVARRDQACAELRGSARFASAYLEGLENENIPDPYRMALLLDWHQAFWRNALRDVGDSAMNGWHVPLD